MSTKANAKETGLDRVALLRRMQEVVHLLSNQPKFEIGDSVIFNPLIYGDKINDALEKSGQYPVHVVCETRPSWREVSKQLGHPEGLTDVLPESQAVFLTCVDPAGEAQFRWVNAWNFVKAPEHMLQSTNGTSLNH